MLPHRKTDGVAGTRRNGLTKEQRLKLAYSHARLVKHIAGRLAVGLPRHVSLEDLIHDGVVGLMDAAYRYDPSKGIQFSTFASTRIRGAILDGLRREDFASRGARKRYKELCQAQEKLYQVLGRTPTHQELAQELDLSLEELKQRLMENNMGFVCSLDEIQVDQDGQKEPLINHLCDTKSDVEEQVAQSRKRELLIQALKRLKQREQLLLALYYYEGLNIREIAAVLGVSEARVSQIHGRCLRKLRECLQSHQPDLIGHSCSAR